MKFSIVTALFALCFCTASHSLEASSWYRQSGGTADLSNQVFTSSVNDTSGVFITNKGVFSLTNSRVTTTGNTSSQDNSSFHGLNAGVLVNGGSKATLTGCNIHTSGEGANGVFSTQSGSTVTLVNDTITCLGSGGHGVDATEGGIMDLTNCIIYTKESHGAAISTDRGGGTITVKGGTATADGIDSPGIYCTGTITVADATISGTGAEAAVIEGANTITLTNTSLTGAKGTRDRGMMIYQSMSGDATGNKGTFTMTGGSFNWPSTSGPAFYVTNSTGIITLTNVTVSNSSPVLIKAGSDQWGNSGSNGGHVVFTASGETLGGNSVCDNLSSITMTLKDNTVLTGSINKAGLTLDESSKWIVTGESYLSTFSDQSGIVNDSIVNVIGNGHCVYYDSTLTANQPLGKKTYRLTGGGYLTCGACTGTSVSAPKGSSCSTFCPNPADGELRMTVSSGAEQPVTIYNTYGEKVYDKVVPGNCTIDVSTWPGGVYFAMTAGSVQKIVINR